MTPPTDPRTKSGPTLTPDEGPEGALSSGQRVGLVPGPVSRYELDGQGGSVEIAAGFDVDQPRYRVAVYPDSDPFGTTMDESPDWGALAIRIALSVDGEPVRVLDQYGFTDPGEWLFPDQWNLIDLDLSDVVGRHVDSVRLVGADGAVGHGWVQVLGSTRPHPEGAQPLDYVSMTRGSHSSYRYSRGNTFPAVAMPHGAHFLTPLTNARTREWLYSWHLGPQPALQGLAFAHAPSPWIGDRQSFQFMPFVGRPHLDPDLRELSFSHDDEVAKPHLYRVQLAGGILAEATPTDHCGVFRFAFPPSDRGRRHPRGIILDQPSGGNLTIHRLAGGRVGFDVFIPATNEAPPAYVYGETRQPVAARRLRGTRPLVDATSFAREDAAARLMRRLESVRVPTAQHPAAVLRLVEGDELEIKASMSFISPDQARHALDMEVGDARFDEVAARAHDTWAELLGRLSIEQASHDQLVTAYSNLARLFLWPNAHHENVGTPTDPDWRHGWAFDAPDEHTDPRRSWPSVAGKLVVNNGYWDTYRTAWPFYLALTPERAGWLIDGIVQQYRDSGWMSRWSAPGHVDCMVGTSSDAIFADAAAHGVEFDELTAYDSALKNACVPSPKRDTGRHQVGRARYVGWVDTSEREGFSWSVENANCDAAISLWSTRLAARADEMGVPERRAEFEANARYFWNRSASLRGLFDADTGFLQGRNPDGSPTRSADDFDPRIWGGDYAETHAWGMAFSMAHDGAGLAELLGGEDELSAKLDRALHTPESAGQDVAGTYGQVIHEMTEARNLRLGMIAMSNQPAHHIPYMFLHAGRPDRTQWLTREILGRCFVGSDIGQGYPGDEDNGEMSAWWLWSALGLYPLQLGTGEFALTAPLFERASWRISDDATLTVVAHGAAEQNRFIRRVEVNGEPWDTVTIPAELVRAGATIEMWLQDAPSAWGRDSRPASPARAPLPDLTGSAHANFTDSAGRDHQAGMLTDDRGDGLVDASPGSVLTLRWGHDVEPQFFTVTTDAPEAIDADLEYLVGPDWHRLDVTPNAPRFANQPAATLLPGGLSVRGLRWRFRGSARIHQIEVF